MVCSKLATIPKGMHTLNANHMRIPWAFQRDVNEKELDEEPAIIEEAENASSAAMPSPVHSGMASRVYKPLF